MKPFELPFSSFLELVKQIDYVIADEMSCGYMLTQSKQGIDVLTNKLNSVRKKIVKQKSSKQEEQDKKIGLEKFKKIRKLKMILGGKLRPLTDEEKKGLKNGA